MFIPESRVRFFGYSKEALKNFCDNSPVHAKNLVFIYFSNGPHIFRPSSVPTVQKIIRKYRPSAPFIYYPFCQKFFKNLCAEIWIEKQVQWSQLQQRFCKTFLVNPVGFCRDIPEISERFKTPKFYKYVAWILDRNNS